MTKKGISKLFFSVNGVLTKPGLIKDTLTPYLCIIKYSVSVKFINAAFEAPYPDTEGRPLYPAVDATIEIWPCLRDLKNLYQKTKFFKQLLDNMSFEMARSRLEISSLYANTKSEKQFHQVVQNEYELCFNAYKKITGYQILLERNKVISSLINFRNPITDLLSYVQVELLNRHKKHIDRSVDLDNAIFMSINHIAAAMQTTG